MPLIKTMMANFLRENLEKHQSTLLDVGALEINMEWFLVPLALLVSYGYLKFAPMHDIKQAVYYAEYVANQKHKNEDTSANKVII